MARRGSREAEEIGTAVALEQAPEESEYLGIAVEGFRHAPRTAPTVAGVDSRLGFGVELGVALTPVILWLAQVAVDAVKSAVEEQAASVAERGLRSLWTRLLALLRIRSGPRVPAASTLSVQQIRTVRELVVSRAQHVGGIDAARAEAIADAITGRLVEMG